MQPNELLLIARVREDRQVLPPHSVATRGERLHAAPLAPQLPAVLRPGIHPVVRAPGRGLRGPQDCRQRRCAHAWQSISCLRGAASDPATLPPRPTRPQTPHAAFLCNFSLLGALPRRTQTRQYVHARIPPSCLVGAVSDPMPPPLRPACARKHPMRRPHGIPARSTP